MKILKISILLMLLTVISSAQQSTYEFLRLDMSPRSGTLAGSYVANSDDPDVIFYNPAGMNTLEGIPVSFSFLKHLMDVNLASFSGSWELEGIGRFGAAFKYINYGSFTEVDALGNETGEYGAGEAAFIAGYSGEIAENFNYGINGKFIYSSIADYSSSALAVDLGVIYLFPEQLLNIGFSVTTLGTQLSEYGSVSEELPLSLNFGISKGLEHVPLSLFLQFNKLNAESDDFANRFSNFTAGAELRVSSAFRLRIGFDNEKRKELKIAEFAGLAGISLGFGLRIKEYDFGYGFSSLGEAGSMHRLGVSTAF